MTNRFMNTGMPDGCGDFQHTRRKFIVGTASGAAWYMLPKTAFASSSNSSDPRFLTIILRGALDGMAAVPPIGDQDYADLRSGFNLTKDNTIPLDGFFSLNPNMKNFAKLYYGGDALVVHAAGTSYRKRSHFDGQDILESGLSRPGGTTGWLNRATHSLASKKRAKPSKALSLGYTAPLIMRGPAPVMSWAPQIFAQPDQDTLDRVISLYSARDPDMAKLLSEGARNDSNQVQDDGRLGGNRRFLKEIDQTVGFFKDPEGPRIAALSSDGWDTHAGQNPVKGRLGSLLRSLDAGIGKLRDGLAPIWDDTVIVIATEFGRTASINGTRGTDHGTGSTVFVLGGAVKGRRVVSDWPSLSNRALFEGRDLMPTTHVNGVFKGLLADHFGIDRVTLDSKVFPDSRDIKAVSGLLG